jgi:6-phosphogluconolactonase
MPDFNIFTFETEEEFYATALEDTLFAIQETLDDFEEVRIGLAGGSTPKKLYEMLAQKSQGQVQEIPWSRIKLIQLDERYVPSDHRESNLKMLRETLLKKISIPPENLLTFDTSLPPESAAKEMARKLEAVERDRQPIFDLLILGAGADGHIASLFEDDPQTLAETNYASPAQAYGYPTQQRLTITIPALQNTARTLLLLKGEAKLSLLAEMKSNPGLLPLTALKKIAKTTPPKVLYKN